LSAELKNQHSHRAIAAADMLAQMREVWHAVGDHG
jgi:inosine/xanthosine triphosphate pyrophosphatase family protein